MALTKEQEQELVSKYKFIIQQSQQPQEAQMDANVASILERYKPSHLREQTTTPSEEPLRELPESITPSDSQVSSSQMSEEIMSKEVVEPEEEEKGFLKTLGGAILDTARQPANFISRLGTTIGNKVDNLLDRKDKNIFEQEIKPSDYANPLTLMGKIALNKIGDSDFAKGVAEEYLKQQEVENQSKFEKFITGERDTTEFESVREFAGEGIEAAANIGTAFTPVAGKGSGIFYKILLGSGTGALQGSARAGAEELKKANIPYEDVFRSALGGAGTGAAIGGVVGALGGLWDKAFKAIGEGKKVAGRETAQLLGVKKSRLAGSFYWGNDTVGDDLVKAGYLKHKTPEGIRNAAKANMKKFGNQIDDILSSVDDQISKKDFVNHPAIKELLDDETFLQAVPGATKEIEKLPQVMDIKKLNFFKKKWADKVSKIYTANTGTMNPREEFWYKMAHAARETVSDVVPAIKETNRNWGLALDARMLAADKMAADYLRAGILHGQGGRVSLQAMVRSLLDKTVGDPNIYMPYLRFRDAIAPLAKAEALLPEQARNFVISALNQIVAESLADDGGSQLERIEIPGVTQPQTTQQLKNPGDDFKLERIDINNLR